MSSEQLLDDDVKNEETKKIITEASRIDSSANAVPLSAKQKAEVQHSSELTLLELECVIHSHQAHASMATLARRFPPFMRLLQIGVCKRLYTGWLALWYPNAFSLEAEVLVKSESEKALKEWSVGAVKIQHCIDHLRNQRNKFYNKSQERTTKALDNLKRELDKHPSANSVMELDRTQLSQIWRTALKVRGRFGFNLETNRYVQTYYNFIRVRMSYSFLVILSLMMAIFSGLVMEVFFASFVNFQDLALLDKTQMMFWLLVMPLGIMLLALTGDEMYDLILDSFDSPPLNTFLATVFTAVHRDASSAPTPKLCWYVDIGVMVVIEVGPLLHALFLSSEGFWRAYVQGSLVAAGTITVIFIVCEIINGIRTLGKDAGASAGNVLEVKRRIKEAISDFQINPGQLHLFAEMGGFDDNFEERPEEHSVADVLAASSVESINFLLEVYIPTILWIVFSFSVALGLSNYLAPLVGIVLVIVIYQLSTGFSKRFPGIVAGPYYIILVFFLFVTVGCILLNINHSAGEDVSSVMKLPGTVGADEVASELPAEWLGVDASQQYSICQRFWGSPDSPVSALELAELSNIAYEPKCDRIKEMIKHIFPSERHVSMEFCNKYFSLPRWLEFYFPSSNGGRGTRVIAVKGTSTTPDIFADTKLFATIEVMQAFRFVTPILKILPVGLVQTLLSELYLNDEVRRLEKDIWQSLQERIVQNRVSHPDDEYVITGHSLGGGVAQIIASRLRMPSIVFSAPGVVYSAKRFNISLEYSKRNVVVVIPDEDVVPRVDEQAGLVQHTECRDKLTGKPAMTILCHSIARTECEIWRVCGDPLKRDFRQGCEPFVDPGMLGKEFSSNVVS